MPLTRPKTKMLSGTIPAANLSLASSDMPAGTILQRVYDQPTTNGNTISTTSYVAIGMDLSITPKRSGSHFLIESWWLVYDNAGSGTLKVESAVFRGSTNISGNLTHTPYSGEGINGRMPYGGIAHLDTGASAVAGTAITYSMKYKKNQSSEQSFDVAHNDKKSAWIMVTEIAT